MATLMIKFEIGTTVKIKMMIYEYAENIQMKDKKYLELK